MEEVFRRAQMCIDAIKGCSIHASIATIKCYACDLERELIIIRDEVQKLKEPQIPRGKFGEAPKKGWGKSKIISLQEWEAQFKQTGAFGKNAPIPPPVVSYDQQAEKK